MIIFIETRLSMVYEVGKKKTKKKRITKWGRNNKGCVRKIGYVKEVKDGVATVDEC